MRTTYLSIIACLCALGVDIYEAEACGGCFHQEEQATEQISVVTAHTMALSISSEQTVLWDRVQYSGSPEEFAWVLPVRPGAYLEVATDAWFEALEAATGAQIVPPRLACDNQPGFGCGPSTIALVAPATFACSAEEVGSDGGGEGEVVEAEPVTVVHQGSVGPYETVTLSTEEPDALPNWLIDNGYAVGEDIFPILEDYAADGFDFIALRLAPDQGVQHMKPVRVVQSGAVATLPLRMVAAGTGAQVGLTLYVIAEGRWQTSNFPPSVIPTSQLSWDFDQARSNYSQLRQNQLGIQGGRSWLTTFARKNALLSPLGNPIELAPVRYFVNNQQVTTIADVYAHSAWANGESDNIGNCQAAFFQHADSQQSVVAPCPIGEPCEVPGGFIDADELACGDADDLATAMIGMRPRDVWVTRIEAELPRSALADDLVLEAEDFQSEVLNWHMPSVALNPPCELAANIRTSSSHGGWLALVTLGGLFIGMTLRRRV
jgi:Uncharacterized protein conserved in bacteria (DUF2330)